MGKTYGYGSGHTEIISMGIERFILDPLGFAQKDPQYFDFMMDILQ